MSSTAQPKVSHLHTNFLFPFSLDRDSIRQEHVDIWKKHPLWIDGLDEWIAAHCEGPIPRRLGKWKRSAYCDFDVDSSAYQEMVFFHPFVRRIFFDTVGMAGQDVEMESLIRFYTLPVPEGMRLFYKAEDLKGRKYSTEVTALRLVLFANGIGVLSLSVECQNVSASHALWINEMMRKVYPSSGRQIREGRMPSRQMLILEHADGELETILEEVWEKPSIIAYQPPLTRVLKGLLYFTSYERLEYETVLDERMIVYTYVEVDSRSVAKDYQNSADYQVLVSRILYVDRFGDDYRYDPRFLAEQMREDVYRRWAHQGTYYGCTPYSNVTVTIGEFDCDDHRLSEGFLIHRMFQTRYYLMALIALFYRATLLDLSERTALISKALYRDYHDDREFREENIDAANSLLVEFLHFANYWHFDELANKDEEQDHFVMQCRAYRVDSSFDEVENSVRRLNASLNEYYESRQMGAVNRLAILSVVFGAGALLTGFFGMNFAREFGSTFFEAQHTPILHYGAIALVSLLAVGALSYGIYLIAANWKDYREAANPNRKPRPLDSRSVKRLAGYELPK